MRKRDKIKIYIHALVFSPALRLYFSIFLGLVVNVIYIVSNLHTALIHRSFWSSAVIVYYLMFILLRLYLLHARGKDEHTVLRSCLTVGILLLILTALAGVIIAHSVINDNSSRYSGFVLIGFFIYTVYALTSSLLGMKKWLNDNQPLHFAARSVTFAAALMSVFNLQYSLLTSLGLSEIILKRANALGGFSVFFLIMLLGVSLIFKSIKRL